MLLTPKGNFQILEAFSKAWYATPKDKAKKLGQLYKATIKPKDNGKPGSGGSEQCIARVIEFDRITNYVIEDYLGDLALLEILKFRKAILPTLGYHITENGLTIFQPQMISLFELLHCDERSELRKNLTTLDKYHLAFSLAKILNTCHAFNPPIVHAHLSAHNVFVEFQSYGGPKKASGVRLGDLELAPLIKYASTFYNYKNISVWSAPEILKTGKKVADNPTPEIDVYSFGMILWELWHEHVPFENDLSLYTQYVL